MKTQELNYALIVLRKKDADDNTLYLAREREFELIPLHDCYNDFGQKIGITDAEDYSIENEYCDSLRSELMRDFKTKNFSVEGVEEIENVDDLLEFECKEIKKWVSSWREKHENVTMAKALNYFNGHNWRSVIIECDIDYACNYEELESNEIIESYENVEFEEEKYGKRIGTYNNYEFMQSLYYGDPFESSIIL